jgi:hypothetical protein
MPCPQVLLRNARADSHWINTMYRWVPALAATVVALGTSLAATAQVPRNFPHNALKGRIAFGAPPDVLLNDRPARMAPGVRIRGADNMLVMSHSIVGQRYTTLYTVDTLGLVKDVWLLRTEELGLAWPKTAEEAARLHFDPIAQTWTRP